MSIASVYIPLSQGKVAVIDWEDRHLAEHKWTAMKAGRNIYARRTLRRPGEPQKTLLLHRVLCPNWGFVDHKDGDGLNCRRENLRESSPKHNPRAFVRKRVRASSQFRGVTLCKHSGRWISQIRFNNQISRLGRFVSEEDAARAYDAAAAKFGFEREALNFPG